MVFQIYHSLIRLTPSITFLSLSPCSPIIQQFTVHYTLLNIMIVSSIHLPANKMIWLFFVTEQYSIVHIYHIFLIYSWVTEYLSYFQNLAIVTSTTTYMMCKWLYCILAYIPLTIWPGVASLDPKVDIYLGLHISSHDGCTSIHSHHSGQGLLFHHILTSICYLCYWWLPFWLQWGEISALFGFQFSLWTGCWAFLHVFIGHL
jgi:hypothetical protein